MPTDAASPKLDLSSLSLPELFDIQARIATVIAEKQHAAKAVLLAEFEAKAKENGYSSLAALLGTPTAPPAFATEPRVTRGRVGGGTPPKYRNPANEAETWTGRGRKPTWVKEHEGKGGTLGELAIV